MTKTRHKRTAVASMFQNGISRNTKCAERDSFRRAGHICSYTQRDITQLLQGQLIFCHRLNDAGIKHNYVKVNVNIIPIL